MRSTMSQKATRVAGKVAASKLHLLREVTGGRKVVVKSASASAHKPKSATVSGSKKKS